MNAYINRLIQHINTSNAQLNPLPVSYMKGKADPYIQQLYATMLASMLVARPSINDNENRLFALLLTSHGITDEPNKFIMNVSQMSQPQMADFIAGLNTLPKQLNFIFEAILLARINAPINDGQINILNELCGVWQIEKRQIASTIYWGKVILGITVDNSKPIQGLHLMKTYLEQYKGCDIDERYTEPTMFVFQGQPIFVLKKASEIDKNDLFNIQATPALAAIFGSRVEKGLNYEEMVLQKKLEKGVDIKAPQSGILYNYQKNNDGITTVDIIELPEYLNTWTSYIEQTVNQ